MNGFAKTTKPTLVLGGHGKTGSRVASRLRAQGRDVLAVSRSTTPRFDWHDPATWTPLLERAGAVYITYQPDLAVPGAVEAIERFTDVALAAGVRRLMLLSGRGEEEAQRAERVLQDSGADWTIVRASWFNQNFSENFLLDGVLAGEVVLPAGMAPEPFVDADDIADVVVAALTDDRHIGRLYEVTGPRLLTFEEALTAIGDACGRTIRLNTVPTDTYAAMLAQSGLPEAYVWLIDYLFRNIQDGRNAYVTDGIEQALGRPPRDFTDYARAVAAGEAWAA